MAAYDKGFARHPERFQRGRSWAKTIVFLVLALAALVSLAYTLVNFATLQSNAADTTGTVRFVAGQRIGLVLSPVFLVLVAAALVFAAVRWGRTWSVTPTGTRLRKRHWRGLSGGRALFDDLSARFRTGDPSAFTPLPAAPSHADVDVEFWTADADRVGFATLVLHEGKNGKDLIYSEPFVFSGPSYDALSAALATGLDERAAPPTAAGPAPAVPPAL
ncbi:hypothetical protein ELQ92_03585 [Labedella populi]|uniref:Uncharacterized protein n=1 Tax=Labedella populi TaxID=2498850 RepID=A0A3S4AGG7_9MICO|nr:hypothetical protein [Labedella populi]RWZ68312.1 hypothetical protein ELQ92_03585 [Labedella populi]